MGCFEDGVTAEIINITSGSDADTANLSGQCIGDIVAVQVQGSHHAVLGRVRQDLLEKRIGNDVLDD